MAHFAFIDSLWFGEGFSSDYPPDQRLAPALWSAWDALGLTVDGTQLVGWWDAAVPVTSSDPAVLSSVYIRPDGQGCVVAVASWREAGSVQVTLSIDWHALGIEEDSVTITAPAIEGFQPAANIS